MRLTNHCASNHDWSLAISGEVGQDHARKQLGCSRRATADGEAQMGNWFGKADDSEGHTHHIYQNRDGSYDFYSAAGIRGCGEKEVSRCDNLGDAITLLEAHTGATVTGIRRD
jgi:hypothetical protein